MSLRDQIDETIKPGDDFFSYVNQHWIEAHPIPDDKARMGVFQELSDSNMTKLKGLFDTPASDDEPFGMSLVRQFYRAAMDEAAVQTSTPEFIGNLKSQVGALATTSDVLAFIADWHAKGFSLVWSPVVDVDDKNSRTYSVRLYQGGLGLPDRDYYLEATDQFKTILGKYETFLTDLFTLLAMDRPDERAKLVIELETKLAKASMSAVERRDPDKTYNLYDQAALSEHFGGLDWDSYLKTQHISAGRPVVVSQVAFMTAALDLLTTSAPDQLHDYLLVHSLTQVISTLGNDYEELAFSFYGKVLRGVTAQEPRWLRIVRLCAGLMPDPTGQLFVASYFDETSKAAIKDLVDHLQVAFGKRIDQLEWMSDETKQQAHHKLSTFLPLLGYPDKWKSYDGLELGDSHVANFMAINAYEWQRVIKRIDEPVDREEWLMSPVIVNAYYWPNTNGITFPAGILQPPFFDAGGDFAANFGSIGAVIGHEITHGFDDEGSKFDADGNLKSWWTAADREAFDARAKTLVEQYNGYDVHGRNVNGELTLGENIADLGGIQIAFDGLQAKLAELGNRDEVDGFTPEQRFFIGYATSWCEHVRPEMALQFLVSDPHSPDQFRTNGVVCNVPAFYEAFDIQPGDKLYLEPAKRAKIW